MATLLKETLEFRVETEDERDELIETKQKECQGVFMHKTTYRTKKVKGEVVEDWWIVTVINDYRE